MTRSTKVGLISITLSIHPGCVTEEPSKTGVADSTSREDGAAATRIDAGSVTDAAFVLGVSSADVAAPAGFGSTDLSGLGLNPILMIEFTSLDTSTGEMELLVAWSDIDTHARGYTQGSGPTTSCSGSYSDGRFNSGCDKMWTDMETTSAYVASSTDGAWVLNPEISGELNEADGVLTLDNVEITGSLDLSSLTTELGLSIPTMCLDVGGCSRCSSLLARSCTAFEISGLTGEQDDGLSLVER